MDQHGSRTKGPARSSVAALGASLVVTALLATGCSGSSDPGSASRSSTTTPADEAPAPQPTAPDDQRVDLDEPSFSDPTTVDNPLFPIGDLHSTVLLGNDEGHPLRIETTLLPDPTVIRLEDGSEVETLVSQFVAYLDGRIHEVALDWYAQDDSGAVWYFGEDVFNYEDGVVADTDGTWVAGEDGLPGMIMPADPQAGDAYRPENVADVAFEEVVVDDVGLTLDGPRGPVEGGIVGVENHLLEGHYEDKWFAPGYGEFRSGVGSNLEAMALAVPTDALAAPMPAELDTLTSAATDVFEAAGRDDWAAAEAALVAMRAAWSTLTAGDLPPLLAVQMSTALDTVAGDPLLPAVEAHNAEGARHAAVGAAMAALDLQLQYRPVRDVDRDRFELWARQLLVDSESLEADPGHVAGDVTSLEWTWDRIAHTVDDATAHDVESRLDDLRTAADGEDTAAAHDATPALLDAIAAVPASPAGS
jgi:hypothetical protein